MRDFRPVHSLPAPIPQWCPWRVGEGCARVQVRAATHPSPHLCSPFATCFHRLFAPGRSSPPCPLRFNTVARGDTNPVRTAHISHQTTFVPSSPPLPLMPNVAPFQETAIPASMPCLEVEGLSKPSGGAWQHPCCVPCVISSLIWELETQASPWVLSVRLLPPKALTNLRLPPLLSAPRCILQFGGRL
eukprot:GGOE01025593.1.p1 GENE.GGOE01025593.1~~GGOE01025593.1.p1  ORF type:complete len:188 (-),score=6.89 GGOE01025593.1:212-775(-)